MAQQVPELADMTEVESMVYILRQIDEWNKTCTPEQAATLSRRLMASNGTLFKAEGLTMPYWGPLGASDLPD